MTILTFLEENGYHHPVQQQQQQKCQLSTDSYNCCLSKTDNCAENFELLIWTIEHTLSFALLTTMFWRNMSIYIMASA